MRRAFLFLLFIPLGAPAAEKPAVAELLEDDAETLLPLLTNDGEDLTGDNAAVEKTDVFTGKTALRVGSVQRFNPNLKGWEFPIVEKPGPGEYRFVRFAWKKTANTALMLQLASRETGWDHHRYTAGPEAQPWEAKTLTAAAPQEWVVVTRDVFKDFGAMTLTGIAFSPMGYGGDGLFDHVLLGRAVEDLDKHTLAALKKTVPAAKLTPARLDGYWKTLGQPDDPDAMWHLVAHREQAIPFLKARLAALTPAAAAPVTAAAAAPLIAAVTHHRFVVREQAVPELKKLGVGVLPHLKAAIAAADGEAKDWLLTVLRAWDGDVGADRLRLERCRVVLDAVGTPDAKELSARVAAHLKTPAEEKR